ncbi:MAG: DUF192 domain-containing protein [Treponema sp.]|jgi:uncharacterized membrane protein (UPF0127 family)|nr:DUF192 domain-containing protein [Treponema sp.]
MMNFNFFRNLAVSFGLFFVFAVNISCQSKLEKRNLTILKADGTEISVLAEIAIKPEDRNRGFMERKNIPQGTGMLFVFENDQILNFWMKNTPTPLSIAYISKDGKIKDILDMQPFSLADITSSGYVRYALEVPQGWFKKNGISVGDAIKIDF